MLTRRNQEPLPQRTEPTPSAARAKDLGALRDAVVDAANFGAALWFSYLLVLFYFAIAAGAVTHRDLLLENRSNCRSSMSNCRSRPSLSWGRSSF
jgi:hypothetical protein